MTFERLELAATEVQTEFRSADGTRLVGTFVRPASGDVSCVTVLVHGGGVTRDEGGFFTRLAEGMAAAGIASLRFDLRGHGQSGGDQRDLTLAGVANDIHAALLHGRELTGGLALNLLGASFGGGVSAFVAARYSMLVRRLVLINPLVNYKKRFIDDKPYWHDDLLEGGSAKDLDEHGFLPHSPTFKLGRALLNELFYLRPDEEIAAVSAPTLLVHGTGDTFIPVESSRRYASLMQRSELLEIDGAQHGIAMHDDPQYLHPQTRAWQASTIQGIATWLG